MSYKKVLCCKSKAKSKLTLRKPIIESLHVLWIKSEFYHISFIFFRESESTKISNEKNILYDQQEWSLWHLSCGWINKPCVLDVRWLDIIIGQYISRTLYRDLLLLKLFSKRPLTMKPCGNWATICVGYETEKDDDIKEGR